MTANVNVNVNPTFNSLTDSHGKLVYNSFITGGMDFQFLNGFSPQRILKLISMLEAVSFNSLTDSHGIHHKRGK